MMRIFSGIRPTGNIHIGNYLGAVKQWIELQEKNECVFCIVDMHAVTTPYDPKEMKKNILEAASIYLAAGVNPDKSIIFVQSDVREHVELAWLLGAITPMGELSRMTQFKEKSKQHKDYINAGLFNYPVLMAADIMLYKTQAVPVGKDQEQHVELTRTIARKFNQKFGQTFPEPEAILPKAGAKIMSLQNPKKKMSKTDESKSYISLFDTEEEIEKKIMSATTDSGKGVIYNVTKKPGISNLLTIYSLLDGRTIQEIEKEFKGKGYGDFKKSLAKVLINYLEPFRRKQKELLTREVYVQEILNKGKSRAEVIAKTTMQEVKEKMGLTS
ncbi:MAG: tryptophan--tRNA ligase [Candidatus Staskawiczbacteria bacterium RIFOXYC1_FULL_37_43]|nr:MAG: tryptophan--tRNA ligase [Candidatus Staskawiczbacteria bacterium RIFCSPHIGHO2_01_FULL_37_17]OGZ71334.1 MAG: tryptophan--tRNA ligase [Candidatus Staskawiczbacteria bacterium RIFCSPLOWO2_01_FULL_37_19]OGZ75909.1 MAG: tryptophan--tRNA ligase [Candidatus Staskawiczbacteria bacterium RIFOXYA1_FULL_37_15]OGZ77582.1 MAG: tryptophan--tRNA ligase [Candidatus Staskawiczbacteria bacterium RIFOXYA12_FULL_37_10]OGZ80797.1 MAG: tryptophan--tRNA ligase [Candidatus Staskawiczbacteria bacterium RIFOXYB1